jgi:hypothetical protein
MHISTNVQSAKKQFSIGTCLLSSSYKNTSKCIDMFNTNIILIITCVALISRFFGKDVGFGISKTTCHK